MNTYFNNLNPDIQEYFKILSKEFPEFLLDYINTPAMQKQAEISVSCGTIYTKLFNYKYWYSSLDHSIAVALIIWNFTKDKKQTLSGLFHDIATPAFKHAIDFMNGDYINQESTEDLTTKLIKNSKEIMDLLNRDGIKLEEVCDYHIYPIADNDTPKLSADRLEYTLSNGFGVRKNLFTLDDIKEIYNDIIVMKNEEGIEELGFKTTKIAEKFIHNMTILAASYIDNPTKLSMQFLADSMKKMSNLNLIKKEDLYQLSEKDIIERIKNSGVKDLVECFECWQNTTSIIESETEVNGKYGASITGKNRYINPLIKTEKEIVRAKDISQNAKRDIDNFLNYRTPKYGYFDFEFSV
ncbi:MAG: hypothetical protein J6K42_03840 [Clostridia bacterium]|nr:hypothetical protein [Clostridia bacterium]